MSTGKRFDLSGRTALVTGSSRGIGAALAVGLAEAGADVIVHYAGNADAAETVARRVRDLGRQAMTAKADLIQPDAPRKLVDAIGDFGPIDVLVHNASIQFRKAWNEITAEEFDQQMHINLRAVLELTQLIAPGMVERGWGRIVNIGSVQQLKPSREMAVYAASKSALDNLTINLAGQLAKSGVTVNNLAPGVINTDRNQDVLSDPEQYQRVSKWVPAGRIGQPDDCVGAALLLCTEAGSYITGQTLYVDGGLTL